jgi:hypothetical protein
MQALVQPQERELWAAPVVGLVMGALLAKGASPAVGPMTAARVARVLVPAKAAVHAMSLRKEISVQLQAAQPGLKAARGQVCHHHLPSPSAVPPRSVSFWVFLADGEVISGEERGNGSAGDSGAGVGGDTFLLAERQAERLARCQCQLVFYPQQWSGLVIDGDAPPAGAAAVWFGAGRLQNRVMSCCPEVCMMVKLALKPHAIQQSNRTVKSAAVTDDGGLGQASCSTLAHTLPLTTPAQEGEA